LPLVSPYRRQRNRKIGRVGTARTYAVSQKKKTNTGEKNMEMDGKAMGDNPTQTEVGALEQNDTWSSGQLPEQRKELLDN